MFQVLSTESNISHKMQRGMSAGHEVDTSQQDGISPQALGVVHRKKQPNRKLLYAVVLILLENAPL